MTDRTPTGQATGMPSGNATGYRQDTDRAALSVGEAARQLGVTPDAIRSRLHRGTLLGEKSSGVWQVFLSRQDDPTGTRQGDQQAPTGTKQGSDGPRQDADRQPSDALIRAKDETISRLDDEVSYLRAQLEQTNRERAAERERFDIIHREALNRIEALTAGTLQEPPSDAPERPGTPIESTMADDRFTANGAPQSPTGASDELTAEWSDLTEQLITELGMSPAAARIAAAQELGLAG